MPYDNAMLRNGELALRDLVIVFPAASSPKKRAKAATVCPVISFGML